MTYEELLEKYKDCKLPPKVTCEVFTCDIGYNGDGVIKHLYKKDGVWVEETLGNDNTRNGSGVDGLHQPK